MPAATEGEVMLLSTLHKVIDGNNPVTMLVVAALAMTTTVIGLLMLRSGAAMEME